MSRKIVMSFLILLVIYLSICFIFSLLQQKELKEKGLNETTATKLIIEKEWDCTVSYFEEYPLEPRLEDCENMKTCRCNFCFADVAEITGNLTICEMVWDLDINTFCVAKVTLNSTMCSDVIDEGLREGCLESIQMKMEWMGK